jgi:type IV secretory pathway component VirB8
MLVSSIPTTAMPHAKAEPETDGASEAAKPAAMMNSARDWAGKRYGSAREAIRSAPTIAAAAASATVLIAIATAAALLAPRRRTRRFSFAR